jgi:hypothetical protein
MAGGVVTVFQMEAKYFVGWLPYQRNPHLQTSTIKPSGQQNSILSKKMQYWLAKDFSKDSKHPSTYFWNISNR